MNIALRYVLSSPAIAIPLGPQFPDSKSFSFKRLPTLPSSVLRIQTKDAHPERPSGIEGLLSALALFSLFAQRVFHNSFAIKRFRTLSENCRVCTNNSHSGSPRAPRGTRRASLTKPLPALSFQALTNCPFSILFLLITMQIAGGVGVSR